MANQIKLECSNNQSWPLKVETVNDGDNYAHNILKVTTPTPKIFSL